MISLFFNSCQQEIEQNNEPGFLSNKNNVVWKATTIKTSKIGNSLILEVRNGQENLYVTTTSTDVGTYHLGTSNSNNFATFTQDIDGTLVTYNTSVIEGPVLSFNGIINAGDLYVSGIANTSSNGNGQGLRVKTTVTLGKVQSIELVSPGIGYKSGDIVTILGGNGLAKFLIKDVVFSNGFVKITQNKAGIITGEFRLTASRNTSHPFADDYVTFSEGNFYNLNTN